jgi:hypothetical protein
MKLLCILVKGKDKEDDFTLNGVEQLFQMKYCNPDLPKGMSVRNDHLEHLDYEKKTEVPHCSLWTKNSKFRIEYHEDLVYANQNSIHPFQQFKAPKEDYENNIASLLRNKTFQTKLLVRSFQQKSLKPIVC